jgi:hypothetical protein
MIAESALHRKIEMSSIVRWKTNDGVADISPMFSHSNPRIARAFHFVKFADKRKREKVDIPRLRVYKSRVCKPRATIPESAPGPTIPGPPKTPGTVDGEASGMCSPVGVALGIVKAGLKTLKNSHAKLCTARMARIPQR